MADLVKPTTTEHAYEAESFDVGAYQAELDHLNLDVGQKVIFENDRVRVWQSQLNPGERAVFHTHTIDYFWVCVRASTAYQRFSDGTARLIEPEKGQVDFQTYAPGEQLTHDLENIGTDVLEIVTVELVGSSRQVTSTTGQTIS